MTMIPADAAARLQRLNVSRESLARLEAYVGLLLAWQAKINLIGPSTAAEIWVRHVLDAAQLLPLLPAQPAALADLGSGAGIPGVVLAIAGGHHVHLFESNGKKAAFLGQAIRATGAKATVHQVRLEALPGQPGLPRVGAVTARALAPLPLLLTYAAPFLAQGAIGLFHKGQDVDKELTEATKYWKLQTERYPSITDSRGVILEVKEASRVQQRN